MERKLTVTYSQLADFRKCRLYWDLMYRQNLQPAEEKDYFAFGKAIHHALHYYYANDRNYKKAIAGFDEVWNEYAKNFGAFTNEERYTLDYNRTMALYMLAEYDYLAQRVDNFDVEHCEKKVEYPLPNNDGTDSMFWLKGTIDGIAIDPKKRYWLLEFKTAGDMQDSWIELDEQATIYIWLAEKIFNIRIYGVIYTIMRKKIPTEPKILKSGKMSKDKGQSTSPYMIAKTIKEKGIEDDMTDFQAVMSSKYIKRIIVRRSEHEIRNTVNRIMQVTQDMINPRIYANPGWNCYWDCPYYRLCLGLQDNADIQYMVERFYIRKEATW
jgi:hypothetical protein